MKSKHYLEIILTTGRIIYLYE